MTAATLRPHETPSQGGALRRLFHEPLLHFLVLGAVLFALNAFVSPDVPKERLIDVTPEIRQSIVDLFVSERQRQPSTEELERLIDTWILNETTYREALVQGLDKGDDMIRERINQKMRLLIFSNISVEEPTEADLQAWLEKRRFRFDLPERLSFFELPVGESQAEAEEILRQIESGSEPESVRLRAHIFAKRPRDSLNETFGKEFVDELASSPLGKWRTMQSAEGWHIVRLDVIDPGKRATIDDVRSALAGDWQQERARALAIEQVREMGKSYVIRRADKQ